MRPRPLLVLLSLGLLAVLLAPLTPPAQAGHAAYIPGATPTRLAAGRAAATERATPVPTQALTLARSTPRPPAMTPAPLPAGEPAADAPFHDSTGRGGADPFATLGALRTRLAGLASREAAHAFWADVVALGQMPLIFGDVAVFLYRGEAASVAWLGDFTGWRSRDPLPGARVGQTDIWIAEQRFPLDARFDYQVLVDDRQINDPLNPLRQLGGYGAKSTLRMPAYVLPPDTVVAAGVPRGALSGPFLIESKHLGYTKRFTVYAPAGSPAGGDALRDLPVVYVTDGHEFSHPEMGALPNILDNLIAHGRIPPVMAVFIDPRTVDTEENLRGPELLTNPRFQWFLTQELIPTIDARYPTRPAADARAIVGMSLGGLHATYTAMRQPEWFGLAGLLSPYYQAKPAVLAEVEQAERRPVRLFVSQGTYDSDLANSRALRDILSARGYPFLYLETNDGHSWGNWRGVLDDMLLYFFGR